MTRRMINLFALSTLLAASSLFAAETRVATVKVPFAFRAGEESMPAGEYQISKGDQSVLYLRTVGKSIVILPVGSIAPSFKTSNLVRFERVNGTPVLTEVLVDGGQGFLLRH